MVKRNFAILTAVILFTFAAAEARRGFSSGGSGSGAYNNTAPTSWNIDSTLDADCQNLYGQDCSDLTTAQYEDVKAKNKTATDNNYGSDSDYQTANAKGYTLTPTDGTQWTDAKSPGADNSGSDSDWNTDCDNSFSSTGGCDALTKAQFTSIDDASTGRVAATTAGYSSYDDWQDASALGYSMSSDDATLWGEANDGSVSSAACDAEFAGKACNELTKASFTNAKASNALMAAKIAKVTAGTLTSADLVTDLSLSLSSSSLTSPISAWQLDYLESVLGTTASTTKADWQTTIDGYNAATASAWYIWKIASSTASSGIYATGNATTALFNAAGVSSAVTALSVTNAQIAADIRSSGFSATPSATQMNNFLTEARGFADGTTYASVTTATGNNWSLANFLTATTNGGWTSSSADEASFDECLSSTDDASGGGSTCSVSKSGWTAIDAIASVADGDATLTASNVTSILTATGATANASFSSSNSKHIDYLQSCASGDDAAQAVADCASSSSFTANATGFEIGKAVADNSGSYTLSSVVTTSKLTSVGVPSNSVNVIGANYCGSNGTSSCLTAFRTSLASSGLTASSTPAQVKAKVNEVMRAIMVTVSNGASIPSNTPAAGCSSSVNLDVPATCGHPQWTCSMTSSPSGWTFSNNQIVVPANSNAANNQSATIRMSLNIYTPAYTKDVTRSYDIKTAVDGAANGLKRYSDDAWNAEDPRRGQNNCRNLGGRLATDSEFGQTGGSVSYRLFHWTTADTDITYSGGNWKQVGGKSCNFGDGSKRSRENGGFYYCHATSVNATVYYACADLPTCN